MQLDDFKQLTLWQARCYFYLKIESMKIVKFKNGKYAVKSGINYISVNNGYKWSSKRKIASYCQSDYDTILNLFNSLRVEKTIKIPKYKFKRVEKIIKIPKLKIFGKFFNWLFLGNFN